MHAIIRTILFLVICFINTHLLLANDTFIFNKLRDKNWLLSAANSIYNQDGSYLWIGTDNGVYRYDGYNLKHYMNHLDPTLSFRQHSYQLAVDSLGNLWNASITGLGLYNEKENDFEYEIGKDLITGAVYSCCCIENAILFGGRNKIYAYDYDSKKLSTFFELKETDSAGKIDNLCLYSKDTIVYNFADNIYFYNWRSHKMTHIKCPGYITSLHVDKQQSIWVGVFHKGLYCLTSGGEIKGHFHTKNSNLSSNEILCMENQDSVIWIGTDGGGINLLNTRTRQINRLNQESGSASINLIKSVKCLNFDNNQTMWAGTVRNGVIGIRRSSIVSYQEGIGNKENGLSNRTVLSVFQENEDDKYIWIGTDGEGINRFDLKSKSFKHYPHTANLKIVSITSYDEKNLLLSVYFEGLMLFNKSTGKIKPFSLHKQGLDTSFLTGKVSTNLYRESAKSILLFSDKMYRLDIPSNHISPISIDGYRGYFNILPAGKFRGTLFFHDEKTIYSLNEGDDHMHIQTTGLPQVIINSASVDSSGKIWIGSNKGLKVFSFLDQNYEDLSNNLFFNISTVLSDKKDKVWITHGSTVYVYLQDSGTFALLGKSDGIIPNEYIDQAKYLSVQGDIFLGGTQGLLMVNHGFKLDNMELPKVRLADIMIDGESIHTSANYSADILEIPAGTKSIEMFVHTIENDILRPKVYKFKVNGAHEYVFESHSPVFKMNSPRSGVSSVYVTCQSKNGEWTEYTHLLSFNLLLPWYKSMWFKLLCACLILISLAYAVYSANHRRENRFTLIMQEKEKSVYQEKIRFLIHITHELRTPLTLISAPLKRIIRQSNNSSAHYMELNKIYHQATRMKDLLNMVLDVRKMEVGENVLNIVGHPFNQWVQDVVSDFSDDDESGIKIRTELDEQIQIVNFDKHKCEIVLSNLLVNAIKHSKPGDTIMVKTQLKEPDQVQLSVIDSGPGLLDLDISRLFNSYYQGNNEKLGTGIGLSYSKLLMELQGGRIGAKNNSEKGATFYFELPLSLKPGEMKCESRAYLNEIFPNTSNDDWLELEKKYRVPTKYDTSDKTLLIVDDNRELAEFIKEEYTHKFKKIFIADDGAAAFSMLDDSKPDIIVCDIMMPLMNGYELCQKIKSDINYSHIPVILLTARTEYLSKNLGYKLGADAFMPKPFEPDLLFNLIGSQLKARDEIKQKYMRLSALPEPQTETFSQADEQFLIKLNDVIIANLDNNAMDIPYICRELGMSRGTLYNKLKSITGISCNEYISKIRLEHAKELIKNTDLSFTEIADKTGFSNLSYFSTCFKQYEGKSPSQYREMWRNQQNNSSK